MKSSIASSMKNALRAYEEAAAPPRCLPGGGQRYPTAQVDIVIFPEGLEQNPNHMFEIPKITGPVPFMIRSTLDYLRTNVIKERIIKLKDRAEAVKYFNYPYQALEEAVVNALYHRNHKEREPVEIRIEPSGISILSYSGPDCSISMEAIKRARSLKARRYRNRRLGDFLKELELSEGRATGIPTIQEELRRNGSSEAHIETDEERSYFLIEIPCREGFEMFSILSSFQTESATKTEPETEPETESTTKTEPENKLSRRQKILLLVLDLIAKDSSITTSELAEKCGKSRTTIQSYIRILKRDKRIMREGANKGGQWLIL